MDYGDKPAAARWSLFTPPRSQDNGEIDYDDLYETIRINRDVPAIMMANIGTTMKGAIDDVGKIRDILNDLAVTRSYLHADAALSGMILPFVDDPQPYGFDSVSVSGHKMVGSPLPCGVALTRREYVSRIARAIEYVGVLDTTLTGSRNALTPDELANPETARRTGGAGQGGGEVQAGRREYTEPTHTGPPKRPHHGSHIRRRPRQSGVSGGAGDGSVGGKTRGVTCVGRTNALIGPNAMLSIHCTA